MKKEFLFLLSVIYLSLLLSCASSYQRTPSIELTTAEHILSQMTIEEKVAQLFIIAPEQLSSGSVTKTTPKFKKNLARYPVGGFILFARHIENPSQLRALTTSLRNESCIPPILAIDEEGGRVARLAKSEKFYLPKFKSMGAIGETKDPDNAQNAGQTIGNYLATYGFTLDFAPVVDVYTNPQNKVIGDRSFGSNPYLVSDMANSFLSGIHSTGIKSCIKHFPGHGDTKGDTHADYVAVTKNWEQLKECELIPFIKNFDSTDCVMVAHVTCTEIDSTYPASLSKNLITEKLRGELGYSGLILTDALDMGAIEKNFGSGEASVLAFEAGNDILLLPKDFFSAYKSVLNAVKTQRITIERLDESVLKILKLKGF